tara:strand:+ start:443 stop:760 length:318 start_codon:yes stop_codon:yes gene_type:complete
MSNWSRIRDITNLNKDEIHNIVKTNPILIGHTFTAKQFFETDYEYDIVNCDLIGVPHIKNITEINSWEDVQIKNKNGEVLFLVNPDVYKCSNYTVHIRNKRIGSE